MDIYLVALIVSFVVLLILLFLYLKQRDISNILNLQKEELIQNSNTLLQEKNDLQLQYAVLNTRYEDEIKSSNEKLQTLKDAKDELSGEFKLLANKIFEDKSKQFSSSNKEQLELLLKPFREQITNFSLQTKEQFNTELKDRHLLKDELSRLKQMNEQLSQDAVNLTNALKGENKTQATGVR